MYYKSVTSDTTLFLPSFRSRDISASGKKKKDYIIGTPFKSPYKCTEHPLFHNAQVAEAFYGY